MELTEREKENRSNVNEEQKRSWEETAKENGIKRRVGKCKISS